MCVCVCVYMSLYIPLNLSVPLILFIYKLFSDASFSESLYGLRRRAVMIASSKNSLNLESNEMPSHSSLRKRQKVLSVAFLVSYPALQLFALLDWCSCN